MIADAVVDQGGKVDEEIPGMPGRLNYVFM